MGGFPPFKGISCVLFRYVEAECVMGRVHVSLSPYHERLLRRLAFNRYGRRKGAIKQYAQDALDHYAEELR